MALICRGICITHPSFDGSGGYRGETKKRCQICSAYCNTELLLCPCCSTKLRTKGRNNRARRKRVAACKRI